MKPSKPKKPAGADDAKFCEFWAAYPRSDDRKKAWNSWRSALKDADADAIIAGARRYRDDPNRRDTYTKHATTWLNAGAWDNGPLPARASPYSPYSDPDPADYHGAL